MSLIHNFPTPVQRLFPNVQYATWIFDFWMWAYFVLLSNWASHSAFHRHRVQRQKYCCSRGPFSYKLANCQQYMTLQCVPNSLFVSDACDWYVFWEQMYVLSLIVTLVMAYCSSEDMQIISLIWFGYSIIRHVRLRSWTWSVSIPCTSAYWVNSCHQHWSHLKMSVLLQPDAAKDTAGVVYSMHMLFVCKLLLDFWQLWISAWNFKGPGLIVSLGKHDHNRRRIQRCIRLVENIPRGIYFHIYVD